jgi:hypothetical protein
MLLLIAGVLKVAARLGLAPRSPRLTGAPLTLADLANKVVGHLGNAPSCLLVPSEADFFLPHARWRMAEGFHPKPLPRFYLFSRQGTATQCFTIHKVVPTAGIAPAAFSFASCCSVLLSYAGIGGDGGNCIHHSLLARQARPSGTCAPKVVPSPVLATGISGFRRAALGSLSYEGIWTLAPVLHWLGSVLQTDGSTTLPCERWCGIQVTLLDWSIWTSVLQTARELYPSVSKKSELE